MFFSILFSLLYISRNTVAQQAPDPTKICQSAAECFGKLTEKSSECSKLSAAANAAQQQPKNLTDFQKCNAQTRNVSELITAKAVDLRKQHATCLQSRMSNVQPVNVNAIDYCNQALNNYNNPPPVTLPPSAPTATANPKKSTAPGQQDLRMCRAQEHALTGACGKLAGCCSESYICSLQVASSQAQLSMNQLKIDAEFKRRECNKLKPAPKASSPRPNATPRVGITNPIPNTVPTGGPINVNTGGPQPLVSAVSPSK